MPSSDSWTNIEWVEEKTMQAVEGDTAALRDLTSAVAHADLQYADLPQESRDNWDTCFGFLFEELQGSLLDKLIFNLTRAGYDSQAFRDALVGCLRRQFADYADPAGLLQSLGVHDFSTSMHKVYQRWTRLRQLQTGMLIFHPAHGVGEISEIDDYGNDVRIQFKRPAAFALRTALDDFVFPKRESTLGRLIGQRDERPLPEIAAEIIEETPHCFVPPIHDLSVLKAFMTPRFCSEADFKELFEGQTSRPDLASANKADNSSDAALQLDEVRSLDELLIGLRQFAGHENSHISLGETTKKTITNLLTEEAGKQRSMLKFAEALARLWKIVYGAEWFIQYLQGSASKVTAWQDAEHMAKVTNQMKTDIVNEWLRATAEALSGESFAEICVALPLKPLALAELHFKKVHGNLSEWDKRIRRQIKTNTATADQLVNVWKRDGVNAEELLDPGLILRVLGKTVRGPYIQAHKFLYKLLMQNEQFQDFLISNGAEKPAGRFIAAVRHSTTLNSGERQSLLVKLVRRHPHLKAYVEEKSAARRKKMAPITSERSFCLLQDELQNIINKKIPVNSKAIAHARSYGDLRENAEFKAAKEEQAYLNSRRNELEQILDELRPVNFRDVSNPDCVVPGVQVILADGQGDSCKTRTYYLLGLWDSDPEHHIISYETPLGKILMGKCVDDEITMPDGAIMQIAKIDKLPEDILQWQEKSSQ